MGTIILERIFDLVGCGFLFLVIMNSKLFNLLDYQYIFTITVITIIGILGICFSVFFKTSLIKKTDTNVKIVFRNLIKGITNIKKEKIIPSLLLTIIIWAFYTIEVYLVQGAFSMNLNIFQCMIILIISTISMMIPSMPGHFGTFESAVLYSLALFNITDNFGFCFILHLVSYVPYTHIGLIYFLDDFKFNKMRKIINTGTLK